MFGKKFRFFKYYLAVAWKKLGHSLGDSLINLKITGTFVMSGCPSADEHLVGFELGTFGF